MKRIVRISAGLAIGCSLFASPASAAPPSSAVACAACHSVDGTNRLGPSFKGVYGRKAGTGNGFRYSTAMRKAGITWDDESLDAFIADPQKAIPGNVMPFSGVMDAKRRVEIINYLRAVK
jgi:cytochrome c